MRPQSSAPWLVVLAPGPHRGRRIELDRQHLVVGREPTCDVQLDDPYVSRTHATLERRGNAVYVHDLGSSGGTFVNGAAVTTTRELRAGDLVAFASVQARFEPTGSIADETRAMPTATRTAAPTEPAGVPPSRIDIGEQNADVINVAGRDQFYQHIIQQRESFLREVAATKTKARWLVWTGLLAFVVGFGLFAAADLNFLKQVSNAIQSGGSSGPPAAFRKHGKRSANCGTGWRPRASTKPRRRRRAPGSRRSMLVCTRRSPTGPGSQARLSGLPGCSPPRDPSRQRVQRWPARCTPSPAGSEALASRSSACSVCRASRNGSLDEISGVPVPATVGFPPTRWAGRLP